MDPSKVLVHVLIGNSSADHSSVPAALLLTTGYGKEEQRKDTVDILQRAGFTSVVCHSITLQNYRNCLDDLAKEYHIQNANGLLLVLLNLMDGIELDGYPGLTVLRYIERLGIPFTGSDAAFYHITTSKPLMKHKLLLHNIMTSKYTDVSSDETVEKDVESAADLLGFPLIIKPSVSYASYGISDQSVVHNREDAVRHIRKLISEKTILDGIFMEKFLPGREFTVLVTGSGATDVRVFPAVERTFDDSLPVEKRFLTWERYWNGYDLVGNEPTSRVCEDRRAPTDAQPALQQLARDAYLALGGTGYARVDIREDSPGSSRFFVLEVNAQCSLPFSSSSTIGKILLLSNTSPGQFLSDLIEFALTRKNDTTSQD